MWAGPVVQVGEMRYTHKMLVGKPHEDLGVDGRITVKWILLGVRMTFTFSGVFNC
jgi:hypothetical protein